MLLFDRDIQGVRCAVWHVTEGMSELLYLMPYGDVLWQEAQQRFKSDSRRLEWIAVRALLHVMGEDATHIIYADNGAPLLENSGRYISISHTKGYVCVALSDTDRIGVDIERITDRVERVRSRFVRDDEDITSLLQLLVAWSAKEAVFKLLLRTEVDFKEHLRISGMPSLTESTDKEGIFSLAYINNEKRIDCNVSFEIFPDFVLTLAKESK